MFDDKQQLNNGNIDKDINLLPEKMRSKEPAKVVSSGEQGQTRYTTPTGLSTPTGYEEISWWQRLKSNLTGQKNIKSNRVVNPSLNQSTPLQKLYAQDIKQTNSKTKGNNLPSSPNMVNKTANQNQKPVAVKPASPSSATKTPTENLDPSQNSDLGKPLSVLEKIDQQLQRGLHFAENNGNDSDQFGVNLIPEDMLSEVNEKKILYTLLYAVIISAVILASGFITIQFIQLQEAKKIQKLQQDIQQAENEFIAKSDDLKALIRYQQTYDNINLLLDSHIYWDKLFTFLEQNVANDVHFLNVTADKNGLVSMSLVAKSYEALANQYQIFKQAPEVIKIDINSAVLNEGDQSSLTTSALTFLESDINLTNQATSTATTTDSARFDLRSVVLNFYKEMSVGSQVNIRLDTNIFYRDK
jgi:hypothetical protein